MLIWGHWLEECETAEMLTRERLDATVARSTYPASTGRQVWMQYPPATLLGQVGARSEGKSNTPLVPWLGQARQQVTELSHSLKSMSMDNCNTPLPPDWGW